MQENLTRQKIPTNVNMIILYEPKKRTTFPLQLYTYPELESSTDKVAIEKSLNEITNGYYPTQKENSVIIDEESGSVFDVNLTVKEAKMINGSKIILI